MKMKKEKDIVKFFNRYSEQMLPEDGEQFMEKLKRNMELLPVTFLSMKWIRRSQRNTPNGYLRN